MTAAAPLAASSTSSTSATPSAIAAGASTGPIFGWDVGGAHVKVALIEATEAEADAADLMPGIGWRVSGVAQWACPLWQGIEHLEQVIGAVLERWPAAAAPGARHAITMTGEMVDLFPDREAGVRALTSVLAARLGAGPGIGPGTDLGADLESRLESHLEPHLESHLESRPGINPGAGLGIGPGIGLEAGAGIDQGSGVWFFAGAAGWLAPHECAPHWRSIASANWLASANWVAQCLPDALFIDIGSTTTDIIPIIGARAAAHGHDDATRLATGELVYQGVVRTPLCSIAQRVPFDGRSSNVMNEWFATTADIYRLTGELWEPHDQQASADQGPKTVVASQVRLARMIGRDARDGGDEAWLHLAWHWRGAQLRRIEGSLGRVLASGRGTLSATAPLVGAGCGRFLARELARRCGRPYVDFAALVGAAPDCADWSATCAPSVAVGLLLAAACDTAAHEARAARNGAGSAGLAPPGAGAQDTPGRATGDDRIESH